MNLRTAQPSPRRGSRARAADQRNDGGDERGAILILALAYIIVISVVVAALATWASGDLNQTTKFNSARNTNYALSSALEVAINNIRYTPLVGTGTGQQLTLNALTPSYCWGSGTGFISTLQLPTASNGVAYPNIAVFCSTLEDLGSNTTRTVTLYACTYVAGASAVTQGNACKSNPQLQAIVVFNDYPPGDSTPLQTPCTTYCGEGAILESWDWSSVAGLTSPIANSISITSTPPAIPLVGGTYKTASSATSGDTVVVASSTTNICTVSGVTVSFVADGVCTISFTDLGNANYQAALSQTRTMTVGPVVNAITVNSTPTNPTENGSTYTTVSSATSGDTVAVTSTTQSVCTVSSGIVSFPGNGQCSLDFNDPGNTNYQAAPQQVQTFTVALYAPAGVNVQGQATPQNGYPNNGDSIQYTYNQTMNGSSLLNGFTGSSTSVYVQLTRTNGNATNWQVCNSSNCATVVGLGSVSLGDGSFHNGTLYYYVGAGSTAVFNATMVMSTVSNESVVTVTLGSLVSGTVSALNPTSTQTTLVWTPSAAATSTSGSTPCATTQVTEIGAPKSNF
jgi:hypothetical protein